MFTLIGNVLDGLFILLFTLIKKVLPCKYIQEMICYIKAKNYDVIRIERLYRGGYLSEKYFKKLMMKLGLEDKIESIITDKNDIIEYLKESKLITKINNGK